MKSIKVTIYGRQYPLKVEDDDVDMMYEIADSVNSRLNRFKEELINQSEATIMIMACLSFAEELFTLQKELKSASSSEEILEHVNGKISKLLTDIKEQNYDIK